MMKIFRAAIVALLVPASLAAQQAGVEEAVATITQDDYAYRVGVIAHDSMQGRDTPSPGLDKTAEWAASEFRRMGLRGGVEGGGFIQRYPLRSVVIDLDASGMDFGSGRRRCRSRFTPFGVRCRRCRRISSSCCAAAGRACLR